MKGENPVVFKSVEVENFEYVDNKFIDDEDDESDS